MKPPFITYAQQEKKFQEFLIEYTGESKARIKKEAEEDNYYLVHDLTYHGVKEIFDAGFDAAEEIYKKAMGVEV